MKKILISLSVIAAVAAIAVGGTIAYFSDTETSSGNTFTAGTLDLTLGESGGAPITLTNMKPGDSGSGIITVSNVGSLAGKLYATSKYVAADGTQPAEFPANMTPDEVAKMLVITAFTADGFDMLSRTDLPRSLDGDATDFTVYDMVNDASGVSLTGYVSPGQLTTWYSYDTDMTSIESHAYALTIQFDPLAGNDYQADGITLTFDFLLTQQ